MITHPYIKFDSVRDPIRTEEIIFNKIKDLNLEIEYVGIPIANTINTQGLQISQGIIDEVNKKYPFKKIFVCQHIFVNKLNFGDNLVFTPHTESGDEYHFIPHYNPIYSIPPKRIFYRDRRFNFSFIGDFGTHPSREKLKILNTPLTPIVSTGKWFFSHDINKQKELLVVYQDMINNSKISLCPRGTGPSTLRLFESMSVGSIPVIFNDIKIPQEFRTLIKSIDIEDFLKSPNIFEDLEDGEDLSKNIYERYWDNFSNENLHKMIISKLKEL